MAFAENSVPEDLETARQRFVAFRSAHPVGSRLPEELWSAAAELAARYGLHRTSRVLHLDYTGLKKRMLPPNQSAPPTPAITFMELTSGARPATGCRLEVETAAGKFRVEGEALRPAEIASLLRTFLGQ